MPRATAERDLDGAGVRAAAALSPMMSPAGDPGLLSAGELAYIA